MRHLRRLLLFLLCVAPLACSKEPPRIQEGYRLIRELASDMQIKHQWVLIGNGGAMFHDIEWLFFHFESKDQVSLEQARQLYVEFIDTAVQRVNDDQNIQEYLHERPFSPSGIHCMLSLAGVGKDSVSFVCMVNERIYYDYTDPNSDERIDLHNESYEDARRIVMGE